MDAEQRQMFQDTLLEDEADLEAQLAVLQAALAKTPAAPKAPPRRPRRRALPDHLRRVEHRHEPEDTHCTTADCGQPMSRVGEDISERLDIVPAEFFVHRHIYGKWACRCCQRQGIERLVQEPADPQNASPPIAWPMPDASSERGRVPDGGSIAGAIDYSLNSWTALTRHVDDGSVPIDTITSKPWAMGRRAWLFCGSELAGQRAAIVMSLVQSAKLNGHDPWAYLRDVLERLPSHPNSRIDELLPHRWEP